MQSNLNKNLDDQQFEIKNAIQEIVAPIFQNSLCQIFLKWDDIVEKEISSIAQPYKICNDNYNTLIISVNPEKTLEVFYLQMSIIDSINNFFGEKIINRIKIKRK